MNGGNLQAALFLLNRPEPIRQSSLLMVLATGIGDGQTLIAGLKALASESSAPWSNRIGHLRLLLEQGQTLSEALTSASGLLPEPSLIAIRVGEDTGTLKQVLAEEAQRLMRDTGDSTPVQATLSNTLGWILAVGLVALSIVTFIMVFIIPKFKKIFEDFGMELPDITVSLIGFSDWLSNYWFLIILPGFTMLAILAFSLARWQQLSLTEGRTAFSEYFPRYWSPLILRLMSITVASGHSLNDSLHSILRELRPGTTATKLSAVRMNINAGKDCWEALQQEGFLKSREVSFLNSARRSGHLDWGLIHLARTLHRKRDGWIRVLVNFLQPSVVLFAGLIVGYICISLFMPLIELMNDLS